MPLQRSYGTGLKSLDQFLLLIEVTDQLAAMTLDVEPMDDEPMDDEPTTPPPAAPPSSPPPAPLKRQRSADLQTPSKRRRLDFD